MTAPSHQAPDLVFTLAFFKLGVKDLDGVGAFYRAAFGFVERDRLDFPTLEEAMLVLPGQFFNLVLCRWKDGREVTIGNGFGPIGLVTPDVDAAYARALACGGQADTAPFTLGGNRLAFVLDPEGHQIELIQFGVD